MKTLALSLHLLYSVPNCVSPNPEERALKETKLVTGVDIHVTLYLTWISR